MMCHPRGLAPSLTDASDPNPPTFLSTRPRERASTRKQSSQSTDQHLWKQRRIPQHRVPPPEDVRRIHRRVAVHGDAEGMDVLRARLREGLTGILETVFPLVQVHVIGPTVGEEEQHPVPRALAPEERGGMAHRRAQARVAVGLEPRDARAHRVACGVGEALDPEQVHAS